MSDVHTDRPRVVDFDPEIAEQCLKSLKAINDTCKRVLNEFRATRSVEVIGFLTKERVPLPPNPRNGRDYPEGMPSEYQLIPFFADIRSLPDEHLNTWLGFYDKTYTDDVNRSDKEIMLFQALVKTSRPELLVDEEGEEQEQEQEQEDELNGHQADNNKKNKGGRKRGRSSATNKSSVQAKDKRSKRNPKK
ncbi:uncharacterized protein L199_004593 [Kwoniella botswanensis]|uniref:uncharacterized protein n=1 Tax=Kwoniella botswanensis TaxID=1268659 RepID=UPI00315C4EC2